MQVTIFSVLSHMEQPLDSCFLQKGLLMQTCSIMGIIILYAFCVIRMLVPIEIDGWTKVVSFTSVYNPKYRVARREIIPETRLSAMVFLKYISKIR